MAPVILEPRSRAEHARRGGRHSRVETRRDARLRTRRRRSAVLALVLAAAVLVGIDLARAGMPRVTRPTSTRVALPAPPPSASPTPARAPTTVPQRGPGTFGYAQTPGPLLGTAGSVRRFRVAVETGLAVAPDDFAAAADRVLGDARSWIAGGQLRLQRVPRQAGADFTIFLATPETSTRMCASGGLATNEFTSCRLPRQVIINLARWLTAIRGYGAPLAEYQAYALNHEVGHQLGYGHEACPGPGRPAPVMQQQTLGLQGCLANGWPYAGGRLYSGAPVP
jgi:hypothetical protein